MAHFLRVLGVAALLVAGFAHAQYSWIAPYSWIDEKGVRQLSDRPPPPGTPADKILKAPQMPVARAQETPPTGQTQQKDGLPLLRVGPNSVVFGRVDPDDPAGGLPTNPSRQECEHAHLDKINMEGGAHKFSYMRQEEREFKMKRIKILLSRCPDKR